MSVSPNIKIDTRAARAFLRGLPASLAKAESLTLADARKGLPGQVSGAVSAEYAIKKGDVARAFSKSAAKRAKAAASVTVRGSTLDTATITIRGKKLAVWKTKATPRPKPVRGGGYSARKKYAVSQQIRKGRHTIIKPDGEHRVFLFTRNGKKYAMRVRRGPRRKNHPYPFAATSVPQAVRNPEIVARWKPWLENLILTRLQHHALRLSK